MSRHNGFVLADLVAALAILGVVLVALSVAVTGRARAADSLATSRAVSSAAEDAMTRLQLGQTPTPPESVRLSVKRLEAPAAGDKVWVEVTASRDRQTASLVGMVPAGMGEQK